MDFLDIADAAFYKAGGVIELNDESKRVEEYFKDRNKTVFILIDGMGSIVLNNLLPNSFLNKNVKEVATTIFPSTTAVVLTALATGKYPATHAVNGWFNYILETDESIISLPFINRLNPDEKLKINLKDLFFCDTRMDKLPVRVSTICSSEIVKSEYSLWSRGNTTGYGYRTLKGAFHTLGRLINKDKEKEYIYLYIDDFDTICHKFGPDSDEAKNLLNKIDMFVEKFARIYGNRVNAIITADHGQVRIKSENLFTVSRDDKIMELLKAPPSGDSRFVCFHVRDDKHEEFKKLFNDRYGKFANLFPCDEIDNMHLLGPERMSSKAKERFGDFCAIFDKEHAFSYIKNDNDGLKKRNGFHSGNSDDEMKIPLIIIN